MPLNEEIAQAYNRLGEAQALGQIGAGQAWAQGLQQVGATVGKIPEMVAQQRQLQDEQRVRDARTAFSTDLANTPPLNVDGLKLYDIPSLLKAGATRGFAADYLPSLQHLDAVNQAVQNVNHTRRAALEPMALAVAHSNYDPGLTLNLLQNAEDNQLWSKATIDGWRQDVQNHPEKIKGIVGILAGTSGQKQTVIPATGRGAAPARVINELGETVATGSPASPEEPTTPAGLQFSAAGALGPNPTPAQIQAYRALGLGPPIAAAPGVSLLGRSSFLPNLFGGDLATGQVAGQVPGQAAPLGGIGAAQAPGPAVPSPAVPSPAVPGPAVPGAAVPGAVVPSVAAVPAGPKPIYTAPERDEFKPEQRMVKGVATTLNYHTGGPLKGQYTIPGADTVPIPNAPMPPAAIIVNNAAAAAAANAPLVDASRPSGPTANKLDPATGLTPNGMYQSAIAWGLQGNAGMPPTGRGDSPRASAVRNSIINKGSAIAAAAGVDLPTVRAEYRANQTALNKLLPQAQATANAANAATDNLDLALQMSPNVTRTDSAWVNQRVNEFVRGVTPAVALTDFEVKLYTAAREYAKVTSGGALSAQGLTDSAAKEASALINAAQSPDALAAAVNAMKADMANVTREQTNGLNRVSSTIANFFSAANGTPGPTGAGGPRKLTAQELIDKYK
jgi:uncharacterized protein YqiB (DUF1249 family)